MATKIETVFFDVGGVLQEGAMDSVYTFLLNKRKNLSYDQLKKLLFDRRLTTGYMGTLDNLLNGEFSHLKLTVDDILTSFREVHMYEDSLEAVKEIKAKGLEVGILSDQFAESACIIQERISKKVLFDYLFFSPDLGLTKSSYKIFQIVSNKISKDPEKLLLIDDKLSNVESAKVAGWNGLCYVHSQGLLIETLRGIIIK